MIQLTKNFHLAEFVPRDIYFRYGVSSSRFIDKRIPTIMQQIRDYYSCPVHINTWFYGRHDQLEYRGFRPADCEIGALNSAHKRGTAVDFTVGVIKPELVIKHIMCDYNKYGITLVEENTDDWIHISVEWFIDAPDGALCVLDKKTNKKRFIGGNDGK